MFITIYRLVASGPEGNSGTIMSTQKTRFVNAVDGTEESADPMASNGLNTSMQNTFRKAGGPQGSVKNAVQFIYTLFYVKKGDV